MKVLIRILTVWEYFVRVVGLFTVEMPELPFSGCVVFGVLYAIGAVSQTGLEAFLIFAAVIAVTVEAYLELQEEYELQARQRACPPTGE